MQFYSKHSFLFIFPFDIFHRDDIHHSYTSEFIFILLFPRFVVHNFLDWSCTTVLK